MNIDLSKLTPLPVGPVEHQNDVGPDDEGFWEWYQVLGAKFDNEEDAKFYVLARNAFAGDQEALAWWEENRRKK